MKREFFTTTQENFRDSSTVKRVFATLAMAGVFAGSIAGCDSNNNGTEAVPVKSSSTVESNDAVVSGTRQTDSEMQQADGHELYSGDSCHDIVKEYYNNTGMIDYNAVIENTPGNEAHSGSSTSLKERLLTSVEASFVEDDGRVQIMLDDSQKAVLENSINRLVDETYGGDPEIDTNRYEMSTFVFPDDYKQNPELTDRDVTIIGDASNGAKIIEVPSMNVCTYDLFRSR